MEKWDVHTHTTTSPETFEALARFTHYADFIRVRKHATQPCCAELVNTKGEVQRHRRQPCDAHALPSEETTLPAELPPARC
jgi:hypothetical protein